MKLSSFSRTLALSGLTLMPVCYLLTGCGGGGGGSSRGNPTATPGPTPPGTVTATPSGTATATPTTSGTPAATPINTPIPTPTVPFGGQRILSNLSLGQGQTGVLNLVISQLGSLNGLIIVPPIPAESVGTFLIAPGTYRVTGQFSLPNNFRFAGNLQTVSGVNLPFSAVGKTASGATPGTITVTVGSTTFPTQNF